MLELLQLFIQYSKSDYCYLNNLSWVLLVWLVKTLQNSQNCRATITKSMKQHFHVKHFLLKWQLTKLFFDKNVVENIFSPPFFNKLDLQHSRISSLPGWFTRKTEKLFILPYSISETLHKQNGWRSLMDELQNHNSYYLLIIY